MTIHHRLHLSADIALAIAGLAGLPFRANPGAEGKILVEDICESDPSWPKVALFLAEYHRAWIARQPATNHLNTSDPLADFVVAKFSDAERRDAAYLAMDACTVGYPRPVDAVEFLRTTYETRCPRCHDGERQILPFCLAGEPKWRTRGIFQVNWVDDEFFVKPEMSEKVFRPFGVAIRPVLAYKSRSPLKTVFQLEIPLSADVDVAEASYRTCSACGARKYDRGGRNYAQAPLGQPGPIFKSKQKFRPTHSIVYVSQDLFRSIKDSGFRGAGFIPCAKGKGNKSPGTNCANTVVHR